MAEMISKVETEPKPQMIYSGIKQGTVGFVFGPSKSGKSTYCEALGMSIACGADNFLGLPILMKGLKVLSISLEEYYSNRTERNMKQIKTLTEKYGEEWLNEKYYTIGNELPGYIESQENWDELKSTIMAVEPQIVIIDSLSRLGSGKIEDSDAAKGLMKKLRTLASVTNTTIICIHHTHKMYDKPISLDTLAGSRIIGQEADFMIGVNKTPNGVRYIKEVAFRYAKTNDDNVQAFIIDDNQWIVGTDKKDENKLIAPKDGRNNETLDIRFNRVFEEKETVLTSDLMELFVETGEISRTAVFDRIKKKISKGDIDKVDKGEYKLVKSDR